MEKKKIIFVVDLQHDFYSKDGSLYVNGSETIADNIVKYIDTNKSISFEVTDENLLELSGGIVQGMSGSPIIQNNKIIGAVTHVLINKPDTGYGIYIEWMLQDCGVIK